MPQPRRGELMVEWEGVVSRQTIDGGELRLRVQAGRHLKSLARLGLVHFGEWIPGSFGSHKQGPQIKTSILEPLIRICWLSSYLTILVSE